MNDLPDPRPNRTPEDLRCHAGNIDLLGFTVVSEALGQGELATVRDLLDQAYASYGHPYRPGIPSE